MKKWKKFGWLLVATSLLAATPIYAAQQQNKAARENTKMKQASNTGAETGAMASMMKKVDATIAQTKTLLPYLEEYPFKTVTVDEDSSLIRVLMSKYEEEEKLVPNVVLWLDRTTGELQQFRLLTEAEEDKGAATGENAVKQATAFLKQWYGDDLRGYRYNSRATRFGDIVFSKVVNGLLYPSQSVSVTVDTTGRIIRAGQSFVPDSQFNYPVPPVEETEFPDPKQAIPQEEMETMFASAMALTYSGDRYVYQPMTSGIFDATSGQELRLPYADYDKMGTTLKVTPTQTALGVKTKEAAAAYLQQEHGLAATASELREELSRDQKCKQYVWKEGTGQEAFVQTDAATGEVVTFFSDSIHDQVTKKLTREEARQVAIKEMEKYLPADIRDMVEIVNYRNEGWRGYYFTFVHAQQGIPDMRKRFAINVDGDKVTDLYGVSKAAFTASIPTDKPSVTAQQAAKAYLQKHPLALEYFYPRDSGKQAMLVYRLPQRDGSGEVDARTGTIVTAATE